MMGSLSSVPGRGFSNAYTSNKHARLSFGKMGEPHNEIGLRPDADIEIDPSLRAVLDQFSLNEPEPKVPPSALRKSRSQIFHDAIEQTLTRLREHAVEPRQERVMNITTRKLNVATQLADWMETTLDAQGVTLAVVARQGGLQHKKYDKTGMLHTGIAMFHPREKQWKIYNLVDDPQGGSLHCEVQWTKPMEFFAQQGGYLKNALLLIPDKAAQEKMHKTLLNGDYKKLVFTPEYNMISAPDSSTSLNCNKWILLNVLAAKKDIFHVGTLLADIKKNYRPGEIEVNPFVRLFAAQQPKVKASEVPWWGPIHTVTVESLYHSGLFEKTVFCETPLSIRPV